MIRIEPCNENDYQTLVEIWERSVRATHSFLTEKDIMDIRESLISKSPSHKKFSFRGGLFPR